MASGASSGSKMQPDDLMNFFMEEAQHHIINLDYSKEGDSALTVQLKRAKWRWTNKGEKSNLSETCENKHRRSKKGEKKASESAALAKAEDEELFVFTCTSDYADVVKTLQVLKARLGACIDSGASHHYSPDCEKFENYWPISGQDILTADGHALKAVGIGDIHIELLNGMGHTKALLKDTIHAPEMAFTLISISQLDNANCLVTLAKAMCTIKDAKGHIMATIP